MPQPQFATFRLSNPKIRATALAIFALALMVAAGASGAGSQRAGKPSKRVVAKAQNTTLGKTILTTTKGRTLYSLSVEKHGKFICTGSCLSAWHPLVVPTGVKPTGPVKLGTIVRPDSGVQVTFEGRPLYRFAGDSKGGEVNGEGIKDVGTWHAATAPRTQAQSSPEPPPSPEPPYSGY